MEQTMKLNEKKFIERIIKNYSKKNETKIEKLRSLDKKARKGALVTAYTLGVIGALILGAGMSIVLEGFASLDLWIGIVLGIQGLFIVCVNYLLYKKNLKKGKSKYADQILDLSRELLNEEI